MKLPSSVEEGMKGWWALQGRFSAGVSFRLTNALDYSNFCHNRI